MGWKFSVGNMFFDPIGNIIDELKGGFMDDDRRGGAPAQPPGGPDADFQNAIADALRGSGQYGTQNAPTYQQPGATWQPPQALGRGGNAWRAPTALGGVPPTMSAALRYGPRPEGSPGLRDPGYQALVGPQQYTGPGRYVKPPPPAPPPEEPQQDPNISGGA